jgi:hypothetical protein
MPVTLPGTNPQNVRIFDATFTLKNSTASPGHFELETTIYFEIQTSNLGPPPTMKVSIGVLRPTPAVSP